MNQQATNAILKIASEIHRLRDFDQKQAVKAINNIGIAATKLEDFRRLVAEEQEKLRSLCDRNLKDLSLCIEEGESRKVTVVE